MLSVFGRTFFTTLFSVFGRVISTALFIAIVILIDAAVPALVLPLELGVFFLFVVYFRRKPEPVFVKLQELPVLTCLPGA